MHEIVISVAYSFLISRTNWCGYFAFRIVGLLSIVD